MKSKILITSGVHPWETTAPRLAKKIKDKLSEKGFEVTHIKFPFKQTALFYLLNQNSGENANFATPINEYEFMKNNMELPEHDLHIDFHNNNIRHVAGPNKSIKHYKVGFKVYCGEIFFAQHKFSPSDKYYALEIPAYFKNFSRKIIERAPQLAYEQRVDFKKSREQGLIGEIILRKILEGIVTLASNN